LCNALKIEQNWWYRKRSKSHRKNNLAV